MHQDGVEKAQWYITKTVDDTRNSIITETLSIFKEIFLVFEKNT